MQIEGLPVVDATKPLTFTVTRRDTKRGDIKDPEACAIALACRRTLHSDSVRVHLQVTYIKVGTHWLRYITPNSVRTEIVAFDRGGMFSPGVYTLNPPKAAKKLGRKHVGRKPRGPNLNYHRTEGVRVAAR
jgi:hypothetical protein